MTETVSVLRQNSEACSLAVTTWNQCRLAHDTSGKRIYRSNQSVVLYGCRECYCGKHDLRISLNTKHVYGRYVSIYSGMKKRLFESAAFVLPRVCFKYKSWLGKREREVATVFLPTTNPELIHD